MSQKILHLTPLKEEDNSEDEEEVEEPEKVSPIMNRRLSIKDLPPTNELDLDLSKSEVNNLNNYNKSPQKLRNSAKLISHKIILNKSASSKVDLCLYALEYPPNKRNQEMLFHIKSYLKTMPALMNIISKEQSSNLCDNLIEQISIHLRHEYIPKNNLVCRFGERGEKFYIILKGKISFLVPKSMKCFLNFEEYINYLMQLRKNDEFELITNLLAQNRIIYPIDDDNLDEYLINEYDEYQRNLRKNNRKRVKAKTGKDNFKSNFNVKSTVEEKTENTINDKLDYDLNTNLRLNLKLEERPNIKRITMNINSLSKNKNNEPKKNNFSFQTYKKMGIIVDKINQSRMINLHLENNIKNYLEGENSVKVYLKSNNVQNRDLDPNGRKLVNIYHYEEMSSFESGQTFGFIALVSKACKRASTAIVVEDSDLGVLTKEEYLQFFELLSSKEKKNLYELLKFYNLMSSVSEHKFIKRFYHMFEYKKFYKNHNILETNKPFNELLIFSQGLFNIYISVNIPELNDLITRIKIIRGKLLGLSRYKIESSLEEKRENVDLIVRRNYMSEKESKIILKKYNYIISIISDHLILGYPDTVDPKTNKPLFNCVCSSAESDGYSISNKSIGIINQDSEVIHRLTEFCLMKIDYNLTRLKQFKKEILSKIKENELSSLAENKEKKDYNEGNNIYKSDNYSNENNKNTSNEVNFKRNNLFLDKINYINRNEINNYKTINNNKKKLLTNKLNTENALNLITKNKKEEIKNNYTEKNLRKTYNINPSRNDKLTNLIQFNSESKSKEKSKESTILTKLRENILNKQRRMELNPEDKKNYNTLETNPIKHSLSSESFKNTKDISNKSDAKIKKGNKKNLKKMKFKSMNIFKNYLKDFDMITSLNNKLLSPLLTKSTVQSLPTIKNKNIKLKNFLKENNDKKENEITKKNEKNIIEDLYKIDQLSFVKEKFLVFESNKITKRDKFNTINYDFLPKINRNNKNHPMKIKRQFFNGLNKDIIKKNKKMNNKEDNQDIEDKKTNNLKTLSSNLINKQKTLQKNINDKYHELNNLVNNMHNITKDILSKKNN